MILYDNPASGNCMKCRMLLRELGLPHETVVLDIFAGETRSAEHLARNPDGRVPVLELDSGETIAESGAILLHLAEGTPLLPAAPPARARVYQWLFFEQNQVEPELAVARFMRLTGADTERPGEYAHRVERGRRALETLERAFADGRAHIAGDAFTIADIALYAYVEPAAAVGADPRAHAHLAAWLDRVQARAGFVNDLAPFPPHAAERPI